MTRRERHINIIDNFGVFGRRRYNIQAVHWELNDLLINHGLALLTDEAIEMLARRLLASRGQENKINAEYARLLAAARLRLKVEGVAT